MNYLPSNGKADPPKEWTDTGSSKTAYAAAQACAAQFMMTYLTFDIANTQTLESSVYMLSAGGKKRFYSHDTTLITDYMDPLWRASAQKQHLSQSTQVEMPVVLQVQQSQQRLMAWMSVRCKVTKKINGSQQPPQTYAATVLVIQPPGTSTGSGNSWQVSAWRNSAAAFALPSPL
jgi:hypothetical protein